MNVPAWAHANFFRCIKQNGHVGAESLPSKLPFQRLSCAAQSARLRMTGLRLMARPQCLLSGWGH
jgi:hypothetical protein